MAGQFRAKLFNLILLPNNKRLEVNIVYTVYKHVNKINGKVYIGVTKRIPEIRWGKNGANYKSSPHFFSAIQKYGWDNFYHIILYENKTQQEASELERVLVKEYKSNDRKFGYNSTSGGELSFELNEESKKKKSLAMIGNRNGAHPCAEETKQKIRNAQIGKSLTKEHIKKLKIAASNRKSPPCSDEKKIKLQNKHPAMKKVYCVETKSSYKSIHECARVMNLCPSAICAVCNGRHKTHNGLHFYYLD